MRSNRRGMCCKNSGGSCSVAKRRRNDSKTVVSGLKRRRLEEKSGRDPFDALPDDLVLSILSRLSASARCPSDFISVQMTCKRLRELGLHPLVLSKASSRTFAIKAANWCDSAHNFLKLCADAGNVEASYTLGMVRFYCLEDRRGGASLMARAAIESHAQAMYSLAVIQFNGSGRSRNDKNLRAGVALCGRATYLGHIDATREFGHCLQDGYGTKRNMAEGRRFLLLANARELATVLSSPAVAASVLFSRSIIACNPRAAASRNIQCPLLSDFGCNVPAPEAHPVNQFLVEWFAAAERAPGSGLRLCSHVGCGRPETRKHEFRRCSVCGTVNYCSRACQALDWKLRHKAECSPAERWVAVYGGEDDEEVDGNDNVMDES